MEHPVSAVEQQEFWEMVENRREPSHPVVTAFAKPKVEIIARTLRLPRQAKFLEIGCGNGFFTACLSERWEVTALDRSRRMLSLNPHKNLLQGSVERLPFPDRCYDIVFSANLLHHLEDPQHAVKEMVRVSKRFLVLIEPNRNNPLMYLFSRIKKEERGAVKFSLDYLTGLIRQEKLNLLFSCTHGSVVPNKTPKLFLPFLNPLNKKILMGFYIMAIAERPGS